MPRGPRQESSTGYYHWINRGINHKKIFHSKKDFKTFLGLIKEYKERFEVQLYHYCLMSNHIHLLISVKDREGGLIHDYYRKERG